MRELNAVIGPVLFLWIAGCGTAPFPPDITTRVRSGMTRPEVEAAMKDWPRRINTRQTEYGVSEKWTYMEKTGFLIWFTKITRWLEATFSGNVATEIELFDRSRSPRGARAGTLLPPGSSSTSESKAAPDFLAERIHDS